MLDLVRVYARLLRAPELTLACGPPMLGALFSAGRGESADLVPVRLVAFAAAIYLLGGHIYSYNNLAGRRTDRRDASKRGDVQLLGDLDPRRLAAVSVALLASSTAVFAIIDWRLALLALAEALAWFLYCDPRVLLKGRPLTGSLVHLITGEINFLLGYGLVRPLDPDGLLVGLFFALLFTGGHLNHELRDEQADRANGFRTNPVVFGRIRVFAASLAVFTLASIYLALLAWLGTVTWLFAIPVLAALPMHLALAGLCVRSGLDFAAMHAFRTRYRVLYGGLGMYMAVYLVARL